MDLVKRIFLFSGANLIGFFSVMICYMIGLKSGKIDIESESFDVDMFERWFLGGTIMVWAACAVFSLSYFLLDKKTRRYFLALPAAVPLLYGLSVLFFML